MTFTEHLGELRLRIMRSGMAVIACVLVCYVFSNQIFFLIARPLFPRKAAVTTAQTPLAGQPGAAEKVEEKAVVPAPIWVTQNPAEAFWVKLKLAGYSGVLLALPILMYQLCAFIFPGLKTKERMVIRFLIGGCSVFAVLGVLVAYLGVFPLFLPYLVQWVPEGVEQQFRMNETVSLILMFLFGFSISFQFPMAVMVLVYLGLLTPAALKKLRRLAIVVMAVVAGVLTPPDPISMMMMLVPMVILYEASIWMSYVVIRFRQRKTA